MIKPLVSVIIPTYSRPVYLRRAIDSVYSQTWPKIEIIVVDDNGEGSRNQLMTKEEVSLYVNRSDFMYLVHTENCNGAQARNTGVKASSGDYVTFLDDIMSLVPNNVETGCTTAVCVNIQTPSMAQCILGLWLLIKGEY